MDIQYDRYSLIINGKREFIRSGAMHYFRLPSQELWRDRLFKLKAAGYNTVDLYFCWNYHSPAPGVYDFTGVRDVQALLEITQELGLYVIARPGPYINAEYSGGGFPGWLLAKKHLPLRNRREGAFEWSDEYMGYVREWWEQIVPRINRFPNVLLMQIENEYATLEVEPDYMQALADLTRKLGVTVPLFHNDLYVAGLYEDIVDIYAFDNYSVTQFETDWREMPEVFQVLDNAEQNLRPFCQNRPLMAAELQAGWFGTWKGYKYEKIIEFLGREHINISTKSLLCQGLTIFNHYKAIGGTNWDYTGSIETYTSYDFGAPISEAGINTERLFESKALNYFLQSFDFTATDRKDDFPLALSDRTCFYGVRSDTKHPEAHWLFLRNLSEQTHSLNVGRYPVEVRPFEVIILPYQVPLQCGYELTFCTSELLHQNANMLVIKANRPITACIKTNQANPDFVVEDNASDVDRLGCKEGSLTFRCPPLDPREYRHLKVGRLNIILLGQHLVDTFWLQENGVMIAGPEVRLPKPDKNQEYGLAQGSKTIQAIHPDGRTVELFSLPQSSSTDIPALTHWKIYNEAPELDGDNGVEKQFQPVADTTADFDANALYEGAAWYRYTLNGQQPKALEIDARHIWGAFLNGQLIGSGQQLVLIHGLEAPPPEKLTLPAKAWNKDGENELLVFVSGLGHPKGFHDDAQTPQGLLSLKIDGQDQVQSVDILPTYYSRRQGAPELDGRLSTFSSSPIVRMRTTFSLPESTSTKNIKTVVPWGLKLEGLDFERINIYLNGSLIGRYWRDCQCQELFYLPTGILKSEPDSENTLELILINFSPFISKAALDFRPNQIRLHPYEVFTRWPLPDTLNI